MYSKNMYFLRTLIFISFVIQITLFVELLINESKKKLLFGCKNTDSNIIINGLLINIYRLRELIFKKRLKWYFIR